jgi:hypothetical protein
MIRKKKGLNVSGSAQQRRGQVHIWEIFWNPSYGRGCPWTIPKTISDITIFEA